MQKFIHNRTCIFPTRYGDNILIQLCREQLSEIVWTLPILAWGGFPTLISLTMAFLISQGFNISGHLPVFIAEVTLLLLCHHYLRCFGIYIVIITSLHLYHHCRLISNFSTVNTTS